MKEGKSLRRERKVIIYVFVYIFLLTLGYSALYLLFINIDGGSLLYTPINEVDERRMHERPFTYIEPISSSNITSVEDLYQPKSFDNDNITVFFPEGERYRFRIGLGPDDLTGTLMIIHENGSHLEFITVWGSRWESSEGDCGGCYEGEFEEGGYLTLNFIGNGRVIFLSPGLSESSGLNLNDSLVVGTGNATFLLPFELTDNVPIDRRVISEVSSNRGSNYRIRYYDSELHYLGGVVGRGTTQTQIPSGYSNVFAVVESEGNLTFHFFYSEPILGEISPFTWFLVGSYIIFLACGVIAVVRSTLLPSKTWIPSLWKNKKY